MTLVIIIALALCLFALAYVTKRRFGVLGLGLAAGLVLSQELTRFVATFLRYGDFPTEPLKDTTAATVILVLAPALVMLFSGPKYYDKRSALVGAVLFALFATIILVGPLARDLPTVDTAVEPFMSFIARNTSWLIVTGIVISILDTLHMHTMRSLPKKGKH